MADSSKGNKVINGFIWRFLERCGAQGVSFIVSIVLARLLNPVVYGTVALVTVFTSILQVFVDGGMSNALIQKKDADDLDFSSVFYFNLLMCLAIYGIMFFCAPFIADFYGREELVPLIRVLSLTLIISGVKSVQQAYVSRHMIFKRFFFATLIGTVTAAVVGIVLAYKGFGVWALVAQYLINATIDTIVLWITVKWRPIRGFSLQRLKGLFSFGWKILASQLIDRLYKQSRTLIIGKVYSSDDLAYYNRGEQYPSLVVDNIDASIDSVLLPSMSSAQDNLKTVKSMTRKALQVGSYILMPMMIGLAVVAEPLVRLMLTEKWLPCVPYLQAFCLIYAMRTLNTANLNAIKAIGRSDLVLKMDIVKKIIGIIMIVITMNISVYAMALGLVVSTFLALVLNTVVNNRLFRYTLREQLGDMVPAILIAVVMGVVVYFVKYMHLRDIFTLIIQVVIGVTVYILLSILLKLDAFKYIVAKMHLLFKKNK